MNKIKELLKSARAYYSQPMDTEDYIILAVEIAVNIGVTVWYLSII